MEPIRFYGFCDWLQMLLHRLPKLPTYLELGEPVVGVSELLSRNNQVWNNFKIKQLHSKGWFKIKITLWT